MKRMAEISHNRTAAAAKSQPLHSLLDERAATAPDKLAFRFLPDGESAEELLDYSQLATRARTLAGELVRRDAVGKPVLLVQPPGLDFIAGLFACWYAGAIAVPCYPPRGSRHRTRLAGVLKDCGAKLALAPAFHPALAGVEIVSRSSNDSAELPTPDAADPYKPCLLQYTSGSTGEPKGVILTHENFRSHFACMRPFHDLGWKSALSWLPPYHDMGLVLKILYSFEAGIPLTFFPPEHFIQRPVRWLRAISDYRAELSGAPNFAYEMCLRSIRDEELDGLDLSCWRSAPTGAERVRADTLDRFAERFAPFGFRPEAFGPGYGLAEATLIVTASPTGKIPARSVHPQFGTLVSNGLPLPGTRLRIVDPDTGADREEREIGEIRVAGPTVSAGYWKRPKLTAATFADGELCTGDLGYLEDGQLYVTGRIKDLIIVDGTNFSPEDIEAIVLERFPEITAAAAFATTEASRETVTLALEGKVSALICGEIRRLVGEALELAIGRIVVTRAGLLPRTTSGKIRRAACRNALKTGTLPISVEDAAGGAVTPGSPAFQVVLDAISEVTGHNGASVEDDLISLGMGSLDITRLSVMLREKTGANLSIGSLFAARSLAEIALAIEATPPIFPPTSATAKGLADGMTHSQERMWFLHQLDPESAAYHVFGSMELTGPLDQTRLETAVQRVAVRHEILRSRHGIENGRPRVWIEDNGPISLVRVELQSEAELQEFLTCFAKRTFSLATEAPIRASLATRGADRAVLAICAHHLVADGWSLRILAREIATAYAGEPLGEVGSYLAHAAWHRHWIESGAVTEQVGYWKSKLAGHAGVTLLPVDFPPPSVGSPNGMAVERDLPADLCNRISTVARAHRATPFMVHLAAFLLLLRRHGAGDDLVVAVPVANRNHPGTAGLVGTLVNTLPFRQQIDASETFSQLLEHVRISTLEMQSAQDAPFEKIIEAIQPGRTRNRSPLAQVMFDYQEIPVAERWAGGVTCRPYTAHRGAVQFDLNLLLKALSDRQQLSLEYRADLFLPETAAALLDRYVATLEDTCGEPHRKAAEISCLTAADRAAIEATSHGPLRSDSKKKPVARLIAERAAKHPQRIAVAGDGGSHDYAAVESRSNALAAHLRDRGVQPGDRLAILLERNTDLPVALLATWKVGAAYVPLDAANPPQRLALILQDQAPVQVLLSKSLAASLPDGASTIVLEAGMMEGAPDFASHEARPSDAAYVIYTSGSTGKPKGVVVSHGALANFILSMAESPGFTEADRLLAVTTVSFDISALEIFLPLAMGGSVEIATSDVAKDGAALLTRLKSSGASVMQATPATWRMLMEAGWDGSPDLKILCGGEALDLPLAQKLGQMGYELWNLYGPTETTVWSTIWRVPKNPHQIRIGRPIANTGIHVLAADGMPVPPGVPGELWISGDGLAEGYWERPDLTARNFVTLPGGRRGYSTGDLARWHADGLLECVGRSDHQVKIRGFRVELGEIEAALAAHPAVAQAKVALRGADPASRKLVAWITQVAGGGALDFTEIREFLGARLPVYMVPADIGEIPNFPLNASGKVDVSTLENPVTTTKDDEPMTVMETRLAAIWAELLERPNIGKQDDWFHVGGHSMLALRLFARIHGELKRRLPLSTILEFPTLHGLAAAIQKAPQESEL